MITCQSLGRYGRFANGMFQIAGIIGIADRVGQPFGFPEWFNWDHRERFGSTEDIDLQKYFLNPLPRYVPDGPINEMAYNWGWMDFLPASSGDWNLTGHFQSEKFFKDSIGKVRHYLTMKDEVKNPRAICLHIRRGDYDNAYHPRIDFEYYLNALSYLGQDQPIAIFSDNIGEANRMQQMIGDRSAVIDMNYIDSFRVMKSCKDFICANSTFSLMAAILGDQPGKKIIAPKNWFGPAWGNPVEMARDIYPENCIIL